MSCGLCLHRNVTSANVGVSGSHSFHKLDIYSSNFNIEIFRNVCMIKYLKLKLRVIEVLHLVKKI